MSAEYAIQIAASMPAGETTNAQLDQMIQGLTGAGKGADFFQVAMKSVSASLDSAKAAAAAANASLATGAAQYKELEKAANVAAKAAEKAALSGKLDPSLSRDAHQANAALEAYAHTLKSLEQNAAAATKTEEGFAAQLTNVKKLASHVDKTLGASAEATEKLRGGLASVPGPVGKIGSALLAPVQGFQKLSAQMGASNAAMLLTATAAVGLVVGVVALTAAVIAGTIAIAAWAVGLADSTRNAKLSSEAMEAMHPELVALRGTIAEVTKLTGAHADELKELAGRLKEAKVSAADLPDALKAAALAEAALGKGGSADFIADLKAGKVAASQLSREVQGKLGPIVAKQMRGLDAQSATLKRNIGELFGGLNIEPVLAGLERLGALFDQNTVAGQTIKFLFESVFQPLIDQADKAAIVIEAFALGFLIGLTRLYIALKPIAKALAEFFGFDDPTTADTLDLVKQAGEFVASAFVVFIGIIGALGAACVALAGLLALPFIELGALSVAVYKAGEAIIDGFMSAWSAVKDFLGGFSLVQIGTDIVKGLIDGIINMGPNVLSAITGIADGAIKAAKKALGIASPSKVFAQIGAYTAEGFTEGVDDSAPDAQAAMTGMVDPAPAASKAEPSAPAGAGSSAKGGNYAGAVFNFFGVEGAEDAVARFREMLTLAQEGDLAALGGGD